MATQHTPGPWAEIGENDFSVSHDGNTEGPFGGVVASGWAVVGNPEYSEFAAVVCDMNDVNTWDDETLNANVRLIVAAPEMLAALEWLHLGKGTYVDTGALLAKINGETTPA